MTVYPLAIDSSTSIPVATDRVTTVNAAIINQLRDAIIAIESELGIKPSGTFSTVRARLDIMEDLLLNGTVSSGGGSGNVNFAGDIVGNSLSQLVIGLRGFPLAALIPATNQILQWSGTSWTPVDPSTLDTTARLLASGTVNQGQVVRTTATVQQQVIAAGTNLRTSPFSGIALSTVSDSTLVPVMFSGVVPRNILNLGDGYACAVGVNSSGMPVRATDITCVSAPNWIGDCDIKGNIVIRPRRETSFLVRDFGFKNDGVTANDGMMQILKNALNNSPHNVIEFDEGIYVFNQQIGGTGINAFPFGTIFKGQGISDTFRPDPGPGILAGKTGTVLAFKGAGVGLHIGYADDANYTNGGGVFDLEIRGELATGNSSYPNINEIGLEILGDAQITIQKVRVNGFKYGISIDGGENIWCKNLLFDGASNGYTDMITNLGDNSACAIRIGSFKFTVPGSANGVYIDGAQFNNSFYGVWHNDGVCHTVINSNYELPGAWALIQSPNNVAYENCEGEAQGVANFYFNRTAGPTTCTSFTVRNCFFSQNVPAIKLTNVALYGLVFEGNYCQGMTSHDVINGITNIVGPIQAGSNIVPPTGPSAGALTSGYYSSQAGVNGIPINHQTTPQAALDLNWITPSVPLFRMRAQQYIFSDESHSAALGGTHFRMSQIYNSNTGLIGAYDGKMMEWYSFLAGSATADVSLASSPGRGGGIVWITVNASRQDDPTKMAIWRIRQKYSDSTGGTPVLLGSPSIEYAEDLDGSFTLPILLISSNKFGARIKAHPSQISNWCVKLEIQHAGF